MTNCTLALTSVRSERNVAVFPLCRLQTEHNISVLNGVAGNKCSIQRG